mgnify:FL=1
MVLHKCVFQFQMPLLFAFGKILAFLAQPSGQALFQSIISRWLINQNRSTSNTCIIHGNYLLYFFFKVAPKNSPGKNSIVLLIEEYKLLNSFFSSHCFHRNLISTINLKNDYIQVLEQLK